MREVKKLMREVKKCFLTSLLPHRSCSRAGLGLERRPEGPRAAGPGGHLVIDPGALSGEHSGRAGQCSGSCGGSYGPPRADLNRRSCFAPCGDQEREKAGHNLGTTYSTLRGEPTVDPAITGQPTRTLAQT
jgi:hypothetical protein